MWQETSLGNLSTGLQPFRPWYPGQGEQTSQTCLWDCAKKQQAKPKGEGISGGRSGRCFGECGRTRGSASKVPKNASLHTELDLGSTDALHKGGFDGFHLQRERQEAGWTSSWCSDGVPLLLPAQKPAPFCHQPPRAGDAEAMAVPAPAGFPNLGSILLTRSWESKPRASAPRKKGVLTGTRINWDKWEALQIH